MTTPPPIEMLTFRTQDYTGKVHGDDRIDCYVTTPDSGVTESTGFLLLIHGLGNDGKVAYEADSRFYANEFDLVVTRVEYRHSGREAHHPVAPQTFDKPYDFSKLQAIDCLRAAKATLDRYPQLDRRRMILWGGSQGAHLSAQCLVFAPELWSAAILCCGLYLVMPYERQVELGFAYDCRQYPGVGFHEYTRDPTDWFTEQHEFEIRSPLRHAHLMPPDVPIALIHGTLDDNVDIRHAVELYARLLAHGKETRFVPISLGNHLLAGAEAEDENTRLKASMKHARDLFSRRRATPGVWPRETEIPVTGGCYRVTFGNEGAALHFEGDQG